VDKVAKWVTKKVGAKWVDKMAKWVTKKVGAQATKVTEPVVKWDDRRMAGV
jgi:hypothetical protein